MDVSGGAHSAHHDQRAPEGGLPGWKLLSRGARLWRVLCQILRPEPQLSLWRLVLHPGRGEETAVRYSITFPFPIVVFIISFSVATDCMAQNSHDSDCVTMNPSCSANPPHENIRCQSKVRLCRISRGEKCSVIMPSPAPCV